MAHKAEPMDIDSSMYDFDDKENSLHHSNVLPRTPCTEKGYEELDVSELNMKLRYSITPAASPMSKSFTAYCLDNRNCNSGDNPINNNENGSLTRSLNSSLIKSVLPLQGLPSDQFTDSSRNALKPLDSTVTFENVPVDGIETTEINENLLYPSSSSSSMAHTPEATTPTKDIPKADGASPIMRGLKSVLGMFRSSQSPIPPTEDSGTEKSDILSPPVINSPETEDSRPLNVLASTPLAAHKTLAPLSKRTSPNRESIVFNEDLEKELMWQDETTILFSKEKVPIHKLFFQPTPPFDLNREYLHNEANLHNKLDFTVECMDISYNDAGVQDKSITGEVPNRSCIDSDGEFLDCESTFTKNESQTESLKAIEDENNPARIISDINELIEKSPNANISIKSSDTSMISTETIMGTVKIEASNTVVVPHIVEDTVKIEKKEAKEVTNAKELNSIKHQDAYPAEHSPESRLTKANMLNQYTPLEPTNLDLIKSIETTLLITADNFKSDTVLETDLSVALGNADITQIIESNIENVNDNTVNMNSPSILENVGVALANADITQIVESNIDIVNDNTVNINSPSILENVGVKSISQIALIADPRVLLFNIPSEIPSGEVPREIDVLNTTPADIPLPDDDDIEKVTISSTDLAHNNTVIIHESLSLLNVNTDPDNLEQIKQVPLEEAKLSENDVGNNYVAPEVIKFDLPSIAVKNTLNFGVNKDDILLDPLLVNVEINNKPIVCAAVDNLDINAQAIQQILPNLNLTNLDCMVDQNVIDGTACISEVEVIPSDVKNEAPELSCYGSGDSTITDKVASVKKQISICDTIAESVITSQSDVNQDSEVIVTISGVPEIVVKNDVHIIDKSESVVPAIANVTEQPNHSIIHKNENTSALVHETLMNNASHAENINFSTRDIPVIVAEDKVNVPVNMKHVTISETNAAVPIKENTEQIPSVTTFSITENDENMLLKESQVDKMNQPEATVTTSTNELNTCNNIMPVELSEMPVKTTVSDNDKVDIIDTKQKEALEPVKEPSIEESNDTKAKSENNDEEIVASENNSPFVSVTAEELIPESKTITNFEEIENQFAPKSKIVQTPPSSPKIVSKGYNFNFDEMDDPFGTKTKIRTTPPPGASHNQTFEQIDYERKADFSKKTNNKNRRKFQPEQKKPVTAIKKSNASFDANTYVKACNKNIQHPTIVEGIKVDPVNNQQNTGIAAVESSSVQIKHSKQNVPEIPNIVSNKANETFTEDSPKVLDVESEVMKSDDAPKVASLENSAETLNDKNKSSGLGESTMMPADTKYPSSSEQSSYFSAGTSSNEVIESKSVFNLPEIDDKNFNPFMTMTKIRRSPSTSFEMNNTDTTNSSKATDDKDTTVREVHTEDEDTVEGPFLVTEDLDEDKLSDFDVEMMEFNDVPAQGNNNTEAEELFIDAETFEFLLNQNQANVVADSGKESLFLKFDPLFAKRVSSEGVLAALSKVQERMSTPKKISFRKRDESFSNAPVAGPSTLGVSLDMDNNVTEGSHEDVNVTVSKPMMVVNPAVNPVVTCRNKIVTPTKPNRRSLTFTSPAIAVIDRLLNLSSNNSLVGHEATFSEVNREQEEADRALTQLRELLADKEINVYNLRSESKQLKDRLSTLETQMKSLESVSEERLKKINELTDKLNEKTKINRSMASVVEEYERTIASLIDETEQDKKRHAEERIQLIQERDEQTVHLTSMEVSFNDLHSKYEKSKQVILGFKANEDTYKKSIKDFETNLAKMQTNYELLKQHATSKLNHANDELQKINRSHESEVLKLNALIKRKELHITSLEETLAQKTKANEELTAICDELINKVG